MESKDITVTLAPGHEVTLTTDAPDIKGLVDEIVKVKDIFDPDELKIDCEHEEFDKKSFKEIVLLATKDFGYVNILVEFVKSVVGDTTYQIC